MKMKNENLHFQAVCRGIFTVLCFVIVSAITTFSVWFAYVAGQPLFLGLEPFVANIFAAVMYPFIFNSFATAFSYGDRVSIEEFLAREEENVTLVGEIKNMFSSSRFLTEFITVDLCVALCSGVGLFSAIGGMFKLEMPRAGWCPTVILVPICSLSLIFTKYEASRYFQKLKIENDFDKLLSPSWLLFRILLLTVLYPIFAPMTPLAVYTVISLLSIFAKISAILTVLGAILTFIALIFAVRGIKILKGMHERKKFLKKLTEAVENKGYKIQNLKNPYHSVIKSGNSCNFSLKTDSEEYQCVIISTLWFKTPLVFTSPTDAHFLHRLGTDNHNISIKNNIAFYHTGEGKKIIIINPTPKNVYVTEDRKIKRVQCGDTIWDIGVHDADSFIGCMERDCL